MPDPVDDVRRAYDQIADAWAEARQGFRSRKYVERAVEGLAPGARILDVGCGHGLPIARFLVDQGFDVTGFDVSEAQIEHARENVPEAHFRVGDMRSIRMKVEPFDAIIAWDTVFHVPRDEHAAVFLRFAQWLKPGGRILLAIGGTADEFRAEMLGVEMFYSANTPREEREALAAAGFRLRLLEVDDPSSRGHVALIAEWG